MKLKLTIATALLLLLVNLTSLEVTAQCTSCAGNAGGKGPGDDLDGDGVCNNKDVDDDNDGIPDSIESPGYFTNLIKDGGFTVSEPALTNNGWFVGSGKAYGNNYEVPHPYWPSLTTFAYGANNGQVNSPLTGGLFAEMGGNNANTGILNVLTEDPNTPIIYKFDQTLNSARTYTLAFDIALRGNPVPNNQNYSIYLYNGNTNSVERTLYEASLSSLNYFGYNQPQGSGYKTLQMSFSVASSIDQYYLVFQTHGPSNAEDDFVIDRVVMNSGSLRDTDKDGVPDHQDLDSDNDGILDVIEANPTGYNVAALGTACRYPDGNNLVGGCEDGSTDNTVTAIKSTDEDGVPDYMDLDSDGDGCPDATEANITAEVNRSGYEITKVDSDGLTEAGCAARPKDKQWIDGTPSQEDGCPQEEGGGSLPVVFNSVGAFVLDGTLQVKWVTETERENDHFEIEVSKDGKTWSKAGSNVKTKATDPNATEGYSYEQRISLTQMAVMGISLFLLSMGMMLRRSKWLGAVLAIISLSAILHSCSKNDKIEMNQYEKLYVRIKQINNNGGVNYSAAVTAVMK